MTSRRGLDLPVDVVAPRSAPAAAGHGCTPVWMPPTQKSDTCDAHPGPVSGMGARRPRAERRRTRGRSAIGAPGETTRGMVERGRVSERYPRLIDRGEQDSSRVCVDRDCACRCGTAKNRRIELQIRGVVKQPPCVRRPRVSEDLVGHA